MATDGIFRIASQSKALDECRHPLADGRRQARAERPRQPVHPGVCENNGNGGEGRCGDDRAGEAARSRFGSADAHRRDLVWHRAAEAALYEAKGLGPAAGFGWYTADKDEPICDTMERLASLPFVAQPGEAYVYGYNTDILGCVIERAAGVPLDRFIAERITNPLHMQDTHFYLPPSQRDRLTAVYASGPDGRIVRAPDGARGQGHYVDGARKSFAGGAGLLSTARDYGRFLEMIRHGGALDGVRILVAAHGCADDDEPGRRHLHSPTGLGFGLGFETTDRYGAAGLASVGSYGWAAPMGPPTRWIRMPGWSCC